MTSKKFFIFRRSDPLGPEKRFSENGVDIPILAVPASQISFITAGRGSINITFNEAGMYESNELFVGDSIEKTNVTLSCEVGGEMALIQKILGFVSSEDGRNLMYFDAVDGRSSFEEAVVASVSDIKSKVKSQPTERVSQKVSSGDTQNRFQNIIGDINFGSRENKPAIDYNHKGLYPIDGTDLVAVAAAEWRNAGTAGATYNITGGTGSVTVQTDATAAITGLSEACAQFASNSFLNLPDFTVKDDYTLYFVIGDPGSGQSGEGFGVLFGDDDGQTTGFSKKFFPDLFSIRHDGLIGEPAKAKTTDRTSGTEAYPFPERSSKTGVGERQFCYVFVIRRDKEFNLYLYNHLGEIVAFIPALTINSTFKTVIKEDTRKQDKVQSKSTQGYSANNTAGSAQDAKSSTEPIGKVNEATPGRTDGNLFLQQLGSAASNVTDSFALTLGRFGVITRDIGEANSSQLAQDLYELYKPTT